MKARQHPAHAEFLLARPPRLAPAFTVWLEACRLGDAMFVEHDAGGDEVMIEHALLRGKRSHNFFLTGAAGAGTIHVARLT